MRPQTLAIVLLAAALPVAARQQQVPAKPSVPKINGIRAEFIADLDDVEEKLTQLAIATPAQKYTWRPATGVRSISEVYMHIAGSNYVLSTFVGQRPPADMPDDIEKISSKPVVLAEMKKSFETLRRLIASQSDEDLDKPVNMFGKPATHRYVFITILNHLHEHLGQSIAYARMNDVIPPWSR